MILVPSGGPSPSFRMYAKIPVRKWTVPQGDCIACPTPDAYYRRWLVISSQGNFAHERWCAFDRDNDSQAECLANVYTPEECEPEWANIHHNGEFDAMEFQHRFREYYGARVWRFEPRRLMGHAGMELPRPTTFAEYTTHVLRRIANALRGPL